MDLVGGRLESLWGGGGSAAHFPVFDWYIPLFRVFGKVVWYDKKWYWYFAPNATGTFYIPRWWRRHGEAGWRLMLV